MGEIVLKVDGLEFHAASREDEPRVLDIELATRLGYARPRNVRKLIAKLIADGILNGSEVCCVQEQTSERGGRPGVAYWLVESGALKVMAKSDTPNAIAGLDTLIRAYLEAKRLLAGHDRSRSVSADEFESAAEAFAQQSARVVDDPNVRQRLERAIRRAMRATKRPWQAVEGLVRKTACAPGWLQVAVFNVPRIVDLLEAVEDGRVLLASKGKRRGKLALVAPSNVRQLSLFRERA